VRPGASACRAARYATRRRLLHLHRTYGCFGTSRGLSHDSSSTTSPRAASSSTTSPTPRVRVPRHVTRLVVDYSASCRLVIDYFAYAARPGASARRAARHAARRRLLRLCRASGCLGKSRGSSRSLIVDYLTYAAHPVASARRAACRATHRKLLRLAQARRRLLHLRRASGCLGTSRGSSRRSSSATSLTPRVRVPRHVAWLISPLVVDYFASAARPGASARHTARRRLLRAP
jgi:hypothetical protein